MRTPILDSETLDDAVTACADGAVRFLERLVAAASSVGCKQEGQELVASELERLGFELDHLPVPDSIGNDPAAGVPPGSYEGRRDVIGRSNLGADDPSLLLNGHIDVVPAAEPDLWTSPRSCRASPTAGSTVEARVT